jgi:NAD(P) transhydrogenase subunit alpha
MSQATIQDILSLTDSIKKNSDLLISKVIALESMSAQYGQNAFIFSFSLFVLSCFIGYFVVWKVTPALHTALMSVTNAISGVIIIGAMVALGNCKEINSIAIISFFAIVISSINIFGGFLVTHKMLNMFKK